MREGIERKSCPVCGGQIVVSDFLDVFLMTGYLVKHGKTSKRKRTRSISGSDGDVRQRAVWIAKKCGMPTSS